MAKTALDHNQLTPMPTEIAVEVPAEETIGNLRAELDVCKTDLETLKAERDDAKAKVDLMSGTLEKEASDLAAEISTLRAQLHAATLKDDDLQRRLSLLRAPLPPPASARF
jgi:predicted RNase H-like nuclease (RuvC/YqgF family)